MESDLASQVFQKLKTDESNNFCFDCNAENPDHVSVNHGIFICSNCAAGHLELIEVSIVKSMTETWTKDELNMVVAGGNAALKEYFFYYGFIYKTPINLKYQTRSAAFYRNMLEILSQNVPCESEFLTIEAGILLIKEENNNSISLPKAAEPEKLEDKREVFFPPQPQKGFRAWASRLINRTIEAGNKAFDRLNEIGDKPSLRNIESDALGVVKKVKSVFQPTPVNPDHQEIIEAYKSIAVKATHTYDNINISRQSQEIKREARALIEA